MTTYADPTRCPDCHALLPQTPQVCPVCSLPLAAETAISLFRTLQEADRLLGALRLQKPPSAAVATVSATAATGSRLAGGQSYPTPAAEPAEDGSTTIWFGPERPKEAAPGNWIQTVPGKSWFPMLRLYGPLEAWFDKTWRPGEIEPV